MCPILTWNYSTKITGETDVERDALVDGAFDAAQYFISEYDFSVANDQGSPGAQP
jgi:hypothetical protein